MNKDRQMNARNKAVDSTGQVVTKSLLGRWFWVWVVLAAVILGLRLMTGGTSHQTASGDKIKSVTVASAVPDAGSVEELRRKRAEELQREREKQQLEIEKEKLRADVAARVAKYREDVNALVEKYRKMMPLAKAEEAFASAEQGADFIASRDGLCGFKICGKLAYKMAYDKIKGTHRAEDAINPVVSARIVAPIEDAVTAYEKLTSDFRQELQCEEKAFALDLALRSQKFQEGVSCLKMVDASRMNAAVEKLVGDVREHAKESAFAAAGAVVELAMIKSSYAAIRTVAVRIAQMALAGVAKKLATTASAAVVSMAADGPLPVGDAVAAVITAGGLGWTSHDLYKVCKKMPREMREGVMRAINETRDALRQTAEENLNADGGACLRSAEARAKELEEIINK